MAGGPGRPEPATCGLDDVHPTAAPTTTVSTPITSRRFPPPWSVEHIGAAFVVPTLLMRAIPATAQSCTPVPASSAAGAAEP